jgi:hypothetical protein
MMFLYILVFVAVGLFLKKNVMKLQANCVRIFLKFSTIPILIWIMNPCCVFAKVVELYIKIFDTYL